MILAVGAVELFYEKQGKGRPLILLHGNGEDHHIFDESVDALAKNGRFIGLIPEGMVRAVRFGSSTTRIWRRILSA